MILKIRCINSCSHHSCAHLFSEQKTAPQARVRIMSADTSADTLTLEHQGGGDLILSYVKVIVEQGNNRLSFDNAGNSSDRFMAGDKTTINMSAKNILLSKSLKVLNTSIHIIHPMKNSEFENPLKTSNLKGSTEFSNILTCFQCGTCTASCPSGKYTSLNVRNVVRDSIKKDVSEELDLWMCTTCYNCQERCPRGIKVADAILTLRSIAVKKGRILPAHRKVCNFLIETGHAIPPDEPHTAMREKIGLSQPETVCRYPEALKEVKALLKATGFDELIKE